MRSKLNDRQLSELAERARREHWKRHRDNKTYEEWQRENLSQEMAVAEHRWTQIEQALGVTW